MLSMERKLKALVRLRGRAGGFAPLLFTYGISRISHDVAHMYLYLGELIAIIVLVLNREAGFCLITLWYN